jgi:hypothetical protein
MARACVLHGTTRNMYIIVVTGNIFGFRKITTLTLYRAVLWGIKFLAFFTIVLFRLGLIVIEKFYTSSVKDKRNVVVRICTSEHLGHNFHHMFTGLNVKWYIYVPKT